MATGHKRDSSGNAIPRQNSSIESQSSHNTANSSKSTRRFECTYEGCGKSYTRAEHLGRHQLNHNPKDIYKCDFPGCKRQFVRQDLCTRHRERHDAPGKATEPNTSDDEDGDHNTRRVGRPRLSSLHRNGSIVRTDDGQLMPSTDNGNHTSTIYNSTRVPEITADTTTIVGDLHSTSPRSTPYPRPTIQPVSARNSHSYTTSIVPSQPTRRMPSLSGLAEYTLPALDESPGSVRDEFTAWLFDELPSQNVSGPFLNPSMSMNFFGPTSDFMPFGSTPMFSSYQNEAIYDPTFSVETATTSTSEFDVTTSDDIAWISSSKRLRLIELIQKRFIDAENVDITTMRQELFGDDLDAEDHVLSLRSMQLYLGSYWKHFHQQMPILHQPTFSADSSNDLLVLAVMIIGASRLSGRHGRQRTVVAAKFATFVAWHLRWQIFMHVDFRPPAKLWVFQTMLLLEIYEKLSSTRQMHERAHVHSATMINLMRRGTTLIGDEENRRTPGPTTADEAWHRWIETESTRRAAFAAFVTDATHAVMFGHAAIMVVHELKLPLPCDDALWSATSAAEVGRVHASLHTHGIKPTTFLDGLKRTLTGKKVKTNTFGRTILMSGLLSITWHLHQRDLQVSSLGASSSLGAPGTWREALYKSFEFWKRDFDESMSHMKNASLPWHQITSAEDRDACNAADVLHHLSHIALHVEILDCQIFAGAARLFGRTITRTDYERSKHKMMEWAKTSAARSATFHALRILKPLVTQLISFQDMFKCREDYLLNRGWVIYYALLVLWCYGYALDGLLRPFPVELPTTSTSYPSPEMSWGHVQTPTTSDSQFQSRLDDAKAYFNTVGNVKSPDDLIMLQTGRNRLVGLLGLFGQTFRDSRWELLQEGARRLDAAIQILRDGG